MHVESSSNIIGDSDRADLRATAQKVLEFQRGYLRQRWATYYAAWACAVTTYFLIPFLLGFTDFSKLPFTSRFLIEAALDLVITVVAVAVSILIWGLTERTFALRSAVNGRPLLLGPRNLIRFAIVLTIVAAALAISTRSDLASFVLGDTVLLVLSLLLFLHLYRAFRPIPMEGWLAVAAFIAAAALSYVSLFLLDYTLGHEIAWSAAVVLWFGCAAYARFGVRDDFGGS